MAETDRKNELSPRMERAIAALLETNSLEDAAKAARISARTLRRWRKRDDFRARLREAQDELMMLAVARSHRIVYDSVAALIAMRDDPKFPASARFNAARHLDARRWKADEHGNLRADVEGIKSCQQEHEESL